jgi:hypothetical protein
MYSQGEIYDTLSQPKIKKAKNAFYVELGGNSGFLSLNYERFILSKTHFKIFSRVGAFAFPNGKHLSQYYLVEENFCYGRSNGYLEVGLGLTMQVKWFDAEKTFPAAYDNLYFGIFRLGFRLQSEDKGSVFRAGITPTFYYKDRLEAGPSFQFFGGFSYGIIF